MMQKSINSEVDRSELARMVASLFSLWKISNKDQLSLLGIIDDNELARYHNGEPLYPRLLDRTRYILSIHRSLKLLFPKNVDYAYSWMTKCNKAFDNKTPIEYTKQGGLPGLLTVHNYLKDFL